MNSESIILYLHNDAADGLYIKEMKDDAFSWSIIIMAYTSDYLELELA
jgi:hypothetical protein